MLDYVTLWLGNCSALYVRSLRLLNAFRMLLRIVFCVSLESLQFMTLEKVSMQSFLPFLWNILRNNSSRLSCLLHHIFVCTYSGHAYSQRNIFCGNFQLAKRIGVKFILVFNFSFMLQALESILILNYDTETESRGTHNH